MPCILPVSSRGLFAVLVSAFLVVCFSNKTDAEESQSAGVTEHRYAEPIKITPSQCGRKVVISADQPLLISFNISDIKTSELCELNIKTKSSREENICIDRVDKIPYNECYFMLKSIESRPPLFMYDSFSTLIEVCMYNKYCFEQEHQITLTFTRSGTYHKDDVDLTLILKVTTREYTTTTTRYVYTEIPDYYSDYNPQADDSWAILKEPWFYFILVAVLGLIVCLLKICNFKSTSSTTTSNRQAVIIDTPYPEQESNYRLVPGAPPESQPPTYIDPTPPPDYDTLFANYQYDGTPGVLSSPDNGAPGKDMGQGIRYNMHGDRDSSLPTPPSYEDAVQLSDR